MTTHAQYQSRRQALARKMPSGSIAFIPAAFETLRNGDAHYRFRQDSDFYYLTGFNEPDALLVVISGQDSTSILFNLARDKAHEIWTGKRLGVEDAPVVLGVDKAYCVADVEKILPELLADKQTLYYPVGRFPKWGKTILEAWQSVKNGSRRGVQAPNTFCDIAPLLGEMRLFKSAAEIALMEKAANATVLAHQRAMRASRHAQYEYHLEAELMYEFIQQGCRHVAYDSIVASGENACVLHYTQNTQPLKARELVLIDAGAEFDNYAADVTRTFPANGRFSGPQRAIYELVLAAQRAAIDCVKPGVPWDSMQRVIVGILTQGLIDLGILKGRLDDLIEQNAYKPFYMHTSGHWLGLDVHDCGQYKIDGQWRKLEKDMVLTVEPGLYISKDTPGVDSRWWGIGVRIEDDIQVTEDGYNNLTKALCTDPAEIEAIICG